MADVGVKMGVSGVSQFKSAMNTARSSVKQLDAELKLNAAQYKASGDAEEYMAGRSRILSQQIKAQEEVVSNCEKALETMASQGVDKASSSYTQMAASLARAKTELIQMQQSAKETGEEIKEVGEETDKTVEGLEKIGGGIKFQNLVTGLDKVGDRLKSLWQHAVNIGKAIADWQLSSASWADEISTNARNAGLDVETYQKWENAADYIDTEVDTILAARNKLLKLDGERTVDALDEQGKAIKKTIYDTYATIETGDTQLAVKVRDANGDLLDGMDILWNFIDQLQLIDNKTQRDAISMEYFGKNFNQLQGIIEAGREGWEEAMNRDPVTTEEDVKALAELDDKYQSLENKIENLSHTLASEFAPAAGKVIDTLGFVSDKLLEWLQSDEGQKAVENLNNAISGLLGNVEELDWESIFSGATGAINSIAEFLSNITGEDILDGLKTIGTIIAGWTVGKELMEIYMFFKTMGIGGKLGSTGSNAGANAASSGSPFSLGSVVRGALGVELLLQGVTKILPENEGDLMKGARSALQEGIEELVETGSLDAYQEAFDKEMKKTLVDNPDIIKDGVEVLDKLGLIGINADDHSVGTGGAHSGRESASANMDEKILSDIERRSVAAAAAEEAVELTHGLPSHYGVAVGAQTDAETRSTDRAAYELWRQGVIDGKNAWRIDQNYYSTSDLPEGEGAALDALMEEYRSGQRELNRLLEAINAGEDADPAAYWNAYIKYQNGLTAEENRRNGLAPDEEQPIPAWAAAEYDRLHPVSFMDALLGATADYTDTMAQNGEALSAALGEGAMSNIDAAFAAGAMLAAAFAGGAAAAAGAAGDTTYNSSYVGSVNVYGAQSPAEIAEAYSGYMNQLQAGYGE